MRRYLPFFGSNLSETRVVPNGRHEPSHPTVTYEQVVVPLSQDGMVKPEWISNSINIAAKVWALDDLRKVKPEDIYTNAFLPGAPR